MAQQQPPFGLILPSRPVLTNPTIISPTQVAFTFPLLPKFSHIVIFLLPSTNLPEGSLAGVYLQLPAANGSGSDFQFLGAIGEAKPTAIFEVTSRNGSSSGGGDGCAGTGTASGVDGAMESEMTMDDTSGNPLSSGGGAGGSDGGTVTVGISIEPAQSIASQLEILKARKPIPTTSSNTSTGSIPSSTIMPSSSSSSSISGSFGPSRPPTTIPTKLLAQRIIKNAFNFLSGFAGSATTASTMNTGVGAVGGGNGGIGKREDVVPLKSFQDWWAKFERRIENDPGFLEREEQD